MEKQEEEGKRYESQVGKQVPKVLKNLGTALDGSPYQVNSDLWDTVPKRLITAVLQDTLSHLMSICNLLLYRPPP